MVIQRKIDSSTHSLILPYTKYGNYESKIIFNNLTYKNDIIDHMLSNVVNSHRAIILLSSWSHATDQFWI